MVLTVTLTKIIKFHHYLKLSLAIGRIKNRRYKDIRHDLDALLSCVELYWANPILKFECFMLLNVFDIVIFMKTIRGVDGHSSVSTHMMYVLNVTLTEMNVKEISLSLSYRSVNYNHVRKITVKPPKYKRKK